MKVKTFASYTESALDKKVNEFLSNPSIEVIDIKYSAFSYLSTMIIYREKDEENI